jgi:hypothetical protein
MRRADDPRLQPVIWIVIVGAFVLVLVNADSGGERLAQAGIMAALVALWLVFKRR